MKFTNEDLKRWKDNPNHQGVHTCDGRCALIARLEDAEQVCYRVLAVEDMIKIPLVLGDDSRERAIANLNTAYRTWRKSAGLDQ